MISIYRKNLQNKLSKKGWLARNLAILFQSGNIPNFRCAFSTNIRLGGDVLKKSWRSLQDVISVIASHLANTSWRRFRKTYCKYVLKTSSRRLQDVWEDEKVLRWGRLQDLLKTSWKTRNVCGVSGLISLCYHTVLFCLFREFFLIIYSC